MRIAYLAQSYPPMISGAAIAVEQLANGMAERGHQALVIAASDRNRPYWTCRKNLTILRLRSIHNPLRVGQRFLLNPRRAALQALREFRPDLIHIHEPLMLSWLGVEYGRHARIPTICSIHQLPWFVASYLPDIFKGWTESILWEYTRWLTRKFTAVIAPTQTISNLIKQKTGLQTTTVSYGLDLQTFRRPLCPDEELVARLRLNLPSNVPVILHVGRLDADKNVHRMVYAAAQVMQKTDAHLLIVGDGKEKPALVRLCKSLGIADRTLFTGYITVNNGLADVYRAATVFVTASEIETQGIVLFEAAASGLPIVAVDAACIPEIVHDQINGLLAKPGDIRSFSEAVIELLKNPKKAKWMGKKGHMISRAHTIQNTMKCHEKLYQEIITQMCAPYSPQKHWNRIKGWMEYGKQ